MTMPTSEEGSPEVMRVWLLSGFRVSLGARTIGEKAWSLRKAAAIVKLLSLSPGRRLHREQVMNLLWPHLGRQAASNNLRRTLHAARRALDPDPTATNRYLVLQGGQIALCPGYRHWVDVVAFKDAAATAALLKGERDGVHGGAGAVSLGP